MTKADAIADPLVRVAAQARLSAIAQQVAQTWEPQRERPLPASLAVLVDRLRQAEAVRAGA